MRDAAPSLAVGQVVDRYEILSIIGEGGMAVVLEVRHRELGTRHALKVLRVSFPGIHERLLHEGQVQATIRHRTCAGSPTSCASPERPGS
jgi:serine/threonine protein kinase